jgi:hypothetical protein
LAEATDSVSLKITICWKPPFSTFSIN